MKIPIAALLALIASRAALSQTCDVTRFGAVGNGITVNTAAIQAAIDSCAITGGTVLIPSGTFVTGTLVLKSNVTLKVEGTLQGSTNISHYPDMIPLIRSMTDGNTHKAIIYAENAHHVTLRGPGTINGNGFSFLGAQERPYGIRFISCRNVLYEDITLQNAAFWMMHNLDVDTLTIRNVSIANNANSNNDGISVDASRNVLIENCTVSSFDDPLVFKTTTPLPCENIVVRNCTLSTVARAIKIGTETAGGFRNILIENCTVQPHAVIPVAECGINIAVVDGGFIDGLTLQNITIAAVNTALAIRLGNQGRKYTPAAPVPPVGSLKNITIKNVSITAQSNVTSSITGIAGYYAENITLEKLAISFPGGAAEVRAGYMVPENETARPNCDMFGDTMPAHGLYLRHVKNIRLDDVCFTASAPDQRPAVVMDDVIESPQYTVIHTGANQFCLPQLPSGIEAARPTRLLIFPSPREGLIKIQYESHQAASGSIEIFELTGKQLRKEKIPNESEFALPFSAKSGIYSCRITSSTGSIFIGKFLWLLPER